MRSFNFFVFSLVFALSAFAFSGCLEFYFPEQEAPCKIQPDNYEGDYSERDEDIKTDVESEPEPEHESESESEPEHESESESAFREDDGYGGYGGYGNTGSHFKIPLPPGYDWEVTQSWAEHCHLCNVKGYDTIHGGFFGDFCTQMSHAALCPQSCKYGWDFNLPGEADHGKPVLASADGLVKDVGYNSWGNYVILDHGANVCTRYAHLRHNSIRVVIGEEVCQGLKIGEIGNTGNAVGSHLHFQFERCDTREPIPMGFDDGNGIPVCTMGNDIFDADGNYDFLILSNTQVDDCIDGSVDFGGGEFSGNGWREATCGSLGGCPLIPGCSRSYGHKFGDHSDLTPAVAQAAAYLHSECVIDGKIDGKLHPDDNLTRAEALKVSINLFGLFVNCDYSARFVDVIPGSWYYNYVSCGATYGIIATDRPNFEPHRSITLGEAAKILVESSSKAGIVSITGGNLNMPNVESSHWAYPYLVTLYRYGGLFGNMLSLSAESEISRGDFFLMVTSLSPCYCGNISCQRGCYCDQATLSCRDSFSDNPGSGGGDDSGGSDSSGGDSGGDSGGGSSGGDDSGSSGGDSGGGNSGGDSGGSSSGGDDSGSSGGDSGGGSSGGDDSGSSGGDSGGSSSGGDSGGGNSGGDSGGSGSGGFTCAPGPWTGNNTSSGLYCDHLCNDAMIRLEFSSTVSVEILSVGESVPKKKCFFSGNHLILYYGNNELPAAIKLSGDPGTVKIYRLGGSTPALDVWTNYTGPVSINPSVPPSMTGVGVPLTPFEVGTNSMIRVPR